MYGPPSTVPLSISCFLLGSAVGGWLIHSGQYPSVVIPYGKVDEVDKGRKFELRNNQVGPECEYSHPFLDGFGSTNFPVDDYDLLKGAPCAVQLFTTTLRDEECLQIAKTVNTCLNGERQVHICFLRGRDN